MIDQYIYSRSDGSRTTMAKHIGFGLMYYTDGILPIQQGISDISYYVNAVTDENDKRLELYSKRRVPRCEGKTAIFLSKVIEPERQRSFLHCHGFVMDMTDEDAVNPDNWLYQDFINTNANETDIDLKPMECLEQKATELWPLRELLDRIGLSVERFVSVIRNGITAKNNNTVVLIELDFSQPDISEISAQLIRWIYHLLPYSMRRMAGFTTCYDDNCLSGGYTFVLVPSSIVMERGNKLVIKARKQPGSISYLFAKGQLTHTSSSSIIELDSSRLVYAHWIEERIYSLYESSSDMVRQELNEIESAYQKWDVLLGTLPDNDQISEKYLNAVCWFYLNKNQVKQVWMDTEIKLQEDELEYAESLAHLTDCEEQNTILGFILIKSMQGCRSGYSDSWVRILCRLYHIGSYRDKIREILTIFLYRGVEETAEGELWKRYQGFCDECEQQLERNAVNRMLETLFYPESIQSEQYWASIGIEPSETYGIDLSEAFIREKIGNAPTITDLLHGLNDCWSVFLDFSEEHAESMIGTVKTCLSDWKPDNPKVTVSEFTSICREHQEAENTYYNYRKSLFSVYTHIESLTYGLCVGNNTESIVDFSTQWNENFPLVQNDLAAVFWWEQTLKSVFETITKLSMASLKPLLGTKQDLYAWAVDCVKCARVMSEAQSSQIQKPLMQNFFSTVCGYLIRCAGEISLDRAWFEEFRRMLPYDAKELLAESNEKRTEDLITLFIIDQFVQTGDYSYDGFCSSRDMIYRLTGYTMTEKGINRITMPCLDVLYMMFCQGDFPELGADLLEFIYYQKLIDETGYAHSDFYKELIKEKGGDVWIELLKMYPSAPECEMIEKETERSGTAGKFSGLVSKISAKFVDSEDELETYVPKEGRYEWLQTDIDIYYAIRDVIKANGFIDRMLMQNELFGSSLARVIDEMMPCGSEMETQGDRLLKMIYDSCKQSDNFTSEAQKAMRQLKKEGIL